MYVYVMYDENETVLYVGKTKDMKMRMTQHFKSKNEDWKDDVTNIKYISCYTEVDMSIFEIYLINTLKPKYNMNLLYSGESMIELKYNLKNYDMDDISDYSEIPDLDKIKIRNNLIIYNDKGKSKFNTNYEEAKVLKHIKNDLSSKWCNSNKDKYERIIKNAESFFKGVSSKNKNIGMGNLYISMWSNHVNLENKTIKKFNKHINNFNLNEDIKVICYLRNDYVTSNNNNAINDKMSIMRLVNILKNSAIQNNEKVYLYIPSRRMRNILTNYLNDKL